MLDDGGALREFFNATPVIQTTAPSWKMVCPSPNLEWICCRQKACRRSAAAWYDVGTSAATSRIHQGMLEGSSVNPIRAMTDLIETRTPNQLGTAAHARHNPRSGGTRLAPSDFLGLTDGHSFFAQLFGIVRLDTKLEVIANNIANAGTQGFKGRVMFEDLMYQSKQPGTECEW